MLKGRRFGRLTVLVLVAALAAPACGAIERRRAERERISRAIQRAVDAGSARYRLTAQWKLRVEEDRVPNEDTPAPLTLEGDVDLERNRALAYVAGRQAPPVALFDNTKIFMRRVPQGGADAPQDEVVGLEFDDRTMRSLGGSSALGFVWLNPAYLYRFADGAIIDTVEQVGRDGEYTRFQGGVDRDAAMRGKLDGLQMPVRNQLAAMDVDTLSFPNSQFWIDASGVLRRFRITMRQEVDSQTTFDTTLTLELVEIGTGVEIPRPADSRMVVNFRELTVNLEQLLA